MTHRLTAFFAVLALTAGCGEAGLPDLPNPHEAKPPRAARVLEPIGPAPALTVERLDMLSAVEGARQRWLANSPRAYRLVVSQECFCDAGTPFESRVEGGNVIAATGGVRSFEKPVKPELRTVEALFAEAERLIRSNVDDVSVAFDDRFGYPSSIVVDQWREALDDEWTWRVKLTAVK